MDWEHARYLLVEQQIRPWNVLDQRVLQRFLDVKREEFVPQDKRNLAFVDTELPLGDETFLLAPKVEGRMLQEVGLKSTDRVLVVGAAAGGYLMALAAGLCAQIYSVEANARLKSELEAALSRAGVKNAQIEQGELLAGLPSKAPFDVIILTESVADVPTTLRDQLAPQGRLLAVVGELPVMSATVFTRLDGDAWRSEKRFEYNLPRMRSFHYQTPFLF